MRWQIWLKLRMLGCVGSPSGFCSFSREPRANRNQLKSGQVIISELKSHHKEWLIMLSENPEVKHMENEAYES